MKESRVKEVTLLAKTNFLSLYDAEYINKKGNTKHWTIASRKDLNTLKTQFFQGKEEKIDAVVIAALHAESKKLVLIKQFRIPLNDYVYELPAGLVDGNESMEIAVSRELKEETGLHLLKINYDKTQGKIYASVGMSDESLAIVYCICEGTVTDAYLEEDEDIEVLMVSPQEAREMLKQNIKIDVKANMTLQIFAGLGEDFFLL